MRVMTAQEAVDELWARGLGILLEREHEVWLKAI
jgi:hypothetical protein